MKHTPWSRRIRQLQKAGLSLADIAEVIGLSRGAVGDLAVGRNEEPRAEAAFKLHELHLMRCGMGRGQTDGKRTRRARA